MYIYGVFIGSKWCMGRNKRRALKYARDNHGYVMRVTDCPEISAYDAPTFRVLGELVADYRTLDVTQDGDRILPTPPLSCDMEKGCTAPVSYVDNKGYIYCTRHGVMRRVIRPCRKLTAAELKRLQAGQTISY